MRLRKWGLQQGRSSIQASEAAAATAMAVAFAAGLVLTEAVRSASAALTFATTRLASVAPSRGASASRISDVQTADAQGLRSSTLRRDSHRSTSVAGPVLAFAALASRAVGRRRDRRGLANKVGKRASGTSGDAAPVPSVGVVLLSGGVGKRMGAKIPKQYLKLLGLEIALHSLNIFLDMEEVSEIAIVVAKEWRHVFEDYLATRDVRPKIKYASGGAERQDSVFNGLEQITSELVAVHDIARPLVTAEEVRKVIADAAACGAALLAVKTKATVKQSKVGSEGEDLVASTLDRKVIWEAHTPQVIRADLLREGFKNATENKLEVTDDVSLVEQLGKPVKLTEGEYTNIKVTTPEDIQLAETILRSRGVKPVPE